MRVMEISTERQEEFREHGYSAYETEYKDGESPPGVGTKIYGHLQGFGCARVFMVASVRPSRKLINSYIILLKLADKLP